MHITDWEKWCTDHHIKLKGSDDNDSRPDAGKNHTRVRRSHLAVSSSSNGGPAGHCDLPSHD